MLKTSHHFGLGKTMPDFTLPDTVSKEIISSNHIPAFKAYVLLFICNHCPFVHHRLYRLEIQKANFLVS